MTRKLLKILFGILAFIIGGTIALLIIIPILSNLIINETAFNVIHIIINLLVAVSIYKNAVKYLLQNKN